MAGHWIHWEKGLVHKPEVIRIARALKCTPQHAAACCMMVWEWAENSTTDGIVPGITPPDVSFAAGVPGIGEAMLEVGWIVDTGDGIAFPNWERHNSDPSKQRALKAFYMRVYRAEHRAKELVVRGSRVTKA